MYGGWSIGRPSFIIGSSNPIMMKYSADYTPEQQNRYWVQKHALSRSTLFFQNILNVLQFYATREVKRLLQKRNSCSRRTMKSIFKESFLFKLYKKIVTYQPCPGNYTQQKIIIFWFSLKEAHAFISENHFYLHRPQTLLFIQNSELGPASYYAVHALQAVL